MVYEIAREDFGSQYKAALKVISIPQSEQDLSQITRIMRSGNIKMVLAGINYTNGTSDTIGCL